MSIALLNIRSATIRERRYDKPNFPDPSLGALFSYLKKHNIESSVIDSKLERLNLEETIKKLEKIKPRTIGFTSFTHEIERVAFAAGVIKNKFPKARCIIGGSHANAIPKELLSEFPVFDIAVFGEGEETLLELVRNNCNNLERIEGIAYRNNQGVFLNKVRPSLDLRTLPVIDWTPFCRARYYPVFTSRGCQYKCIFCAKTFGSGVRYRPAQDIIEEMKRIKKLFNPKVIYFWDENFCGDSHRTFELLKAIRTDKDLKGVKWFCMAHVNNLDYELLKEMKSSGCIRFGFGIESGCDAVMKKMGKSITKEKIDKVAAWAKKLRIPFEGYFLFGLPDENWNTGMETIRYATKLNPHFPVFGVVVPYPGTAIYAMARRNQGGYKIIARGWSDYNRIIGKAIELKDLSRRQLELLQSIAYMSVLVRNFRIVSMVRFFFQFYIDIGSYVRNFLANSRHSENNSVRS